MYYRRFIKKTKGKLNEKINSKDIKMYMGLISLMIYFLPIVIIDIVYSIKPIIILIFFLWYFLAYRFIPMEHDDNTNIEFLLDIITIPITVSMMLSYKITYYYLRSKYTELSGIEYERNLKLKKIKKKIKMKNLFSFNFTTPKDI